MRQRRRYNRTISRAAAASPTSRLVNKRQCSGSWFAGGLISRASTRVIDTVAASVLANPSRGRLRVTGPARRATVASRPGSPTRRGATLTCRHVKSGQAAALANSDPATTGPSGASSIARSCAARTMSSTPNRPTGKATVDVALAVADHHYRRRICQQFTGSLDPSQPAHALLVLNRPLTPRRRLDLVVTGPDLCVEQTENSLRRAVNGDQGMDEKPRRNPVAGRAKPAAIGPAAGEIDLGRVLRDDNVPTRGRRERAPGKGRQHLSAADRRRRQKTMDRQLASARRTKFADHQRAARRYPLQQLGAHRCAPCVAEITQCSSLFHHDNPPCTTGSQNRNINQFASQMCEQGGEGPVLAILAMLASLRVAPGGSAPPIPSAARRGEALPGRGGKAGSPIEPESWNDVLGLPPNRYLRMPATVNRRGRAKDWATVDWLRWNAVSKQAT